MLMLFKNGKRVQRHINILNWWVKQIKNKPQLYEIDKVILAVPATKVSV